MMKLKFTVLTLLLVALLTGCAAEAAAPRQLTSEQVVESMRQAGVKLHGLHVKGGGFPGGIYARLLDRVNPDTYSMDTYAMGLVTDNPSTKAADHSLASVVNLSVYVFDSEAERVRGRKDFDKQMLAMPQLQVHPGIYEKDNVMVVYLRDTDFKDLVDDEILEAMDKL
ncbi:hypothetical protein [Paenibacillus sp. OV219]|uniref:hypothetical protein n=1 Tax=Paenibacillus sp. OV219 TaxID=1884377 RepID=UPI0008AEE997|nr:hypothetical protein [Paenibacillus sp. OV219]SEN58620.1 hypothetical protein SAMN05518847_103266 [Paenibacillus sp. OV219]